MKWLTKTTNKYGQVKMFNLSLTVFFARQLFWCYSSILTSNLLCYQSAITYFYNSWSVLKTSISAITFKYLISTTVTQGTSLDWTLTISFGFCLLFHLALSAVPFFKSCLFTSCSYRVYAQSTDSCSGELLWLLEATLNEAKKKRKKEKRKEKKKEI